MLNNNSDNINQGSKSDYNKKKKKIFDDDSEN